MAEGMALNELLNDELSDLDNAALARRMVNAEALHA